MKNRRARIFVIALHAILLVVVYIFQSMIFPYIRLWGLVPLILPLVSTGTAVHGGRFAGAVSGLFAGIFTDLSFNQPLLLFTLILTLLGVGVGSMADTVFAKRFGTYFISCIIVLWVCALVQIFPLLVFGEVPAALLFDTAMWQTIYSLAFTVPIWFVIRKIVSISEES